MDIGSHRFDEKCNGEELLFSISATMRLGCCGIEQAFICSHSTGPLMYSTGNGTLSNVKARGPLVFPFLHT